MSKLKLTPKDCLYLDDAMSQLCAIATRLNMEKEEISSKEGTQLMEECIQVFSTHFEACKQLLKEASK